MTDRVVGATLLVLLVITGCGPSPSPSPSPSSNPSASASASANPTASPPAATPVEPVACTSLPQSGLLPSDRLTNVVVFHQPGRDLVRFTFGEGSLTPAGPANGLLDVALPPFTEGASGEPIDLHGEHALQVVFTGLSLQNDVGQPTYTGPRDIEVVGTSPIVRHAVIFDESEGQLGWYIGYDGSGCVGLTREGSDVVLTIAAG